MSEIDLACGIFLGMLPINAALIGILIEIGRINKK
jgi:hypothetical protein